MAFDYSKHKSREDFWKAFDQLCGETPTKEETCQRIRDNQEHYLEFQQKCLNKYNPTLQQAIEHAGDIIRELTKCCRGGCSNGYIQEKITKLQRIVDRDFEELMQ